MSYMYVEAPQEYTPGGQFSVFLAGGITGCSDWQSVATRLLRRGASLDVLNPRRADFPIDDPSAAEAQIKWEHRHLRKASAILFWFAAGQIQPIALYELGAWTLTSKPLYIGVDPRYPRRQDVRIQTSLVRPNLRIHDTVEDVCNAIITERREQRLQVNGYKFYEALQ